MTVLLVLLNALSTCWQVYPFVPASLLAPRRCIAFRKTVTHHPLALGTLPPRHGSPRLQDDILPSAKRLLDVLASRSKRSAMSCSPPGPKTMYRLLQNSHTPSPSLQKPSTWPQLSVEVIDEDEDDPEMPGMEPVSDDEDEDEDKEDEVVEEPKESAEAELSKLPIDYQQNLSLSYIPRAPIKGLELADQCVLQAQTCHRVHPWLSCPCL